jgi:hypothetical protein
VTGQHTSGTGGNNYPTCAVSADQWCAAGDRVACWFWQNSGTTRTIKLTHFAITRTGAGPIGPQGPAGTASGIVEAVTPPPSPAVGDLWLYHPAAGVTWLFRYEPDQDATYPWQFIGGAALHSAIGGGVAPTAFGVWQQLDGGNPSLVLARAGIYDIEGRCHFNNAAGDWAAGHIGFVIGAATDPGPWDHSKGLGHSSAGSGVSMQWSKRMTIAAGNTVRYTYHSTNVNNNAGLVVGHLSYQQRRLGATPVRVA